MLKLLLLAVLGCGCLNARSQSILELTEQLAIDGEQLAAMRSTLQELVQGYNELKNGFTQIRDIARDNFHLHKTFLDALWVLSPMVRGDPRMGTIVHNASRIMNGYRSGGALVATNPVFSGPELDYINGTLSTLLTHCNQDLEELAMVSADNELRMSDAERLQTLGRIDTRLKAELVFSQEFNNTLAVEAARRQKEAGDLNTLKRLYGLPD
ncbi:MAG TPA: hypothetical protein VHE34_09715 [Puia sp.]|uniref:hypothetical protein n=1 Tax=Puia sp. TaxID=2045100 RepID=UPI002BBAC26A|nr:hypothetical protein [Puia sp.]HVU95491.1 hypothetical protein [Puia sp.]